MKNFELYTICDQLFFDGDSSRSNDFDALQNWSYTQVRRARYLISSPTNELLRKPLHPDYVETPGRRGRPRRLSPSPEEAPNISAKARSKSPELPKSPEPPKPKSTRKSAKVNGSAEELKIVKTNGSIPQKMQEGKDPKKDYSDHLEFGGPLGVSAITIGFPLLMYYMWIGATYYDGHLPLPAKGQSTSDFFRQLGIMIYDGAFPHLRAWIAYWSFFLFEAVCYIYLPGITTTGKPLPHEGGKQLTYYCSGLWSFYTTIVVATGLHLSGAYSLYTILDDFGPLMSVAIISGFLVSLAAYVSALYRDAQHRMTGNHFYDFFMGAELNPRMFGILDFKMFFEVRLPWYILFLVSYAAAARQHEQFGYVTGEVAFVTMAHFLYANACAKGEECIPTTW